MPAPIRVGAVSYLNAKPLYYRLTEFAPGISLEMDLPSRLADRLAAGELDVALIPSVEYLRGAGGDTRSSPGSRSRRGGRCGASSCSAGCRWSGSSGWRSTTARGPARSWPGSGSTHGIGVRPERIEFLPMGVPVQESTADAVLLIGDRAMKVPDDAFHAVVDLAEAWRELTGLPFVFALWVVAGGRRPRNLARSAGAEPGRGAGLRGSSSRPSTGQGSASTSQPATIT